MSQGETGDQQERRDFFISHTGSDKKWAEWIAMQLEEAGYTVFLREWDFRPGSNFVAEMDRATKSSERTLLVLSPAYLASDNTFAEWAAAFRSDQKGKFRRVLPVRIETCDVNGLLGSVIYIDLVSQQEEQARERLLAGVQPGRNKPITAAFPSTQTTAPDQLPVVHFPIRRRWFLLVGLAGAVIVGGGVAWYEKNFRVGTAFPSTPLVPLTSTPAVTSTTLVSVTLGKLITTYHGHTALVKSVTWSPDGKQVASGSYDNTVQVWEATTGKHTYTFLGQADGGYGVETVAWSPDGKRVASGSSDNTVQVWDATDGGNKYIYAGHTDTVWSVAWSLPDNKRIASSSDDKTVQVWDATNGATIYTYHGHTESVWSVAWSPDGKRVASSSDDKTVQVWDATNGANVYTYHGHTTGSPQGVWSVAWSPDGKRIASGGDDGTVQVWNATDGSNKYTYNGHYSRVKTVAWSPDGKRIASGSDDTTVQVWDAITGENMYIYHGHTESVWSVAWSPNGTRIVSGSSDNTAQVWGAGTDTTT